MKLDSFEPLRSLRSREVGRGERGGSGQYLLFLGEGVPPSFFDLEEMGFRSVFYTLPVRLERKGTFGSTLSTGWDTHLPFLSECLCLFS